MEHTATTPEAPVRFETHPSRYVHWKLELAAPVARLLMDVQEDRGLRPGYPLKLNSYDLSVDIELADAIQRLRFEHPEIRVLVVTSGKDRVFCSGANIYMLGSSTHAFKVNFCKFTNETRLALEDASAHSGLKSAGRDQRRLRRAAATSWPWPATRSSSWTTPRRRSAFPRCRCSACCPAPAASPAWWTSARCAATSPTSSRASARA